MNDYRWIRAQLSEADYEAAKKAKGKLTWDDYAAMKLSNSQVYVLEKTDRTVKIGYSYNPKTRAQALQAEHGPLRLLATQPGGRRQEAEAHQRLAESRIGRSEWFTRTPQVDAFVAELLARYGEPDIDDWSSDDVVQPSSRTINIRLSDEEDALLRKYVEDANDRAEASGLPRAITLSAVIRQWIRETIEAKNQTKKVYSAPHVLAAQSKLKGHRP